MSGGTGGHPTFRGFLKASGQAEVWDDTDKKKFNQVLLVSALCHTHPGRSHSYTHTHMQHVHIRTHMHSPTSTHTLTHIDIQHAHKEEYIENGTHMCTSTHSRAHTHTCTHPRTHTHIMHTHTHTHAHTYTHTHTHTCTPADSLAGAHAPMRALTPRTHSLETGMRNNSMSQDWHSRDASPPR